MTTLAVEAAQTIQGVAGTGGVVAFFIDGFEKDTTSGANTPKMLASQAMVPAPVGVLATVPAGKVWLPVIHLSNTSGIPVSGIILYVGGSNPLNQITGRFTLPAYGTGLVSGDIFQISDANGAIVTSSSTATAKNYAARLFARMTWR